MAGGRRARTQGASARKRTRKSRAVEAPPRDLTEQEAKWLGSQMAMRQGGAVTNGAEEPPRQADLGSEAAVPPTPESKDISTGEASSAGTPDEAVRPATRDRFDSFWRFG